jgi:hypothetical protein
MPTELITGLVSSPVRQRHPWSVTVPGSLDEVLAEDSRKLHGFPQDYVPLMVLLSGGATSDQLRRQVFAPEWVRQIVADAPDVFDRLWRDGLVFAFATISIDFYPERGKARLSTRLDASPIDSVSPDGVKANPLAASPFVGLFESCVLPTVRAGAAMPSVAGALPKTMLLSFAAVWSRAIALARAGDENAFVRAVFLVRNPGFPEQRALWHALEQGDGRAFWEYVNPPTADATGHHRPGVGDRSAGATVHAQWQKLFDRLRRGEDPAWGDVQAAADALLDSAQTNWPAPPHSRPPGWLETTVATLMLLGPLAIGCLLWWALGMLDTGASLFSESGPNYRYLDGFRLSSILSVTAVETFRFLLAILIFGYSLIVVWATGSIWWDWLRGSPGTRPIGVAMWVLSSPARIYRDFKRRRNEITVRF